MEAPKEQFIKIFLAWIAVNLQELKNCGGKSQDFKKVF